VTASRESVAAGNPFLALQGQVSNQIIASLDTWRDARDTLQEKLFFGFYGSPVVQAWLGIDPGANARSIPDLAPEARQAQRAEMDRCASLVRSGGFDEALTRSVLYVTADDRVFDQRCGLALNMARERLMHLSLAAFKTMVRDQFYVLRSKPDDAVAAMPAMVPDATGRAALLEHVTAIVAAGGPVSADESDRLARLGQMMEVA